MTSFPQSRFALACAAGLLALTARAAEPAIIAKARAYLGAEAALNAVQSIHFVGTLVKPDPANPDKTVRSAIEIIFQRPERQRVVETSDKMIEITAMPDGYEGWIRREDPANPAGWKQTTLNAAQIKLNRASTLENLAFYRGIERQGGRIEDQGAATTDGVACEKIAFIYAPDNIFYRYFDVATGRLVLTQTASGSAIREQGQMTASGVRFPKTLVQTMPLPDGTTRTITLNFESVTVNETLPAELFAVPAFRAR